MTGTKRLNGTMCGQHQTRREFMRSAAALAAVGASGASAWAQGAAMPPGPWSIIIPTAAGGQADVVARLVGNKMVEALGRPLVIEAKPGAGGRWTTCV